MDYFLHEKCGYQWTSHLQDLTRTERNRLWKGFLLWQTAIESTDRDDSPGKSSSAESLSAGDRKMLRELNDGDGPPTPP